MWHPKTVARAQTGVCAAHHLEVGVADRGGRVPRIEHPGDCARASITAPLHSSNKRGRSEPADAKNKVCPDPYQSQD